MPIAGFRHFAEADRHWPLPSPDRSWPRSLQFAWFVPSPVHSSAERRPGRFDWSYLPGVGLPLLLLRFVMFGDDEGGNLGLPRSARAASVPSNAPPSKLFRHVAA